MSLNKVKKLIIIVIVIVIIFPILIFVQRKNKKEMKSKVIRKAAVAGSFYPAEKSVLNSQIEDFFQKVPEKKEEGLLRILIVPHAGYEYSGQVAVWGFKQLLNKNYSTVILLGGSHSSWFRGAVIDESDVWETPLGAVEIDKNLAEEIVEEIEEVTFSTSAHSGEHSLEVEVPFLQTVLKDFKIVPILFGETNETLLDNLVRVLVKNMSKSTLVVVSTDLSHYPSYEIANEVDKTTVDSILSGDSQNFTKTIVSQMGKGYSSLETCACGEKAVKVGMRLAQKLGQGEWKLLNYANSGDTAEDKSRVVGYAAIGFWITSDGGRMERSGTSDSSEVEELGKNQQNKLLEIARRTLESYLKDGKSPEFEVSDPQLLEPLGTFVTLRKGGQLRGCIGEFEATEPLWKVVQRMAIEAAVKDLRFSPVRLNELAEINIEISVLSPLKKIDDPDEIELGVHGVMIKKGLRKGVFLPQVATETGWDKETFMGQLCSQKAGLAWDCWKKKDIEIFTFTAQVFEEELELEH